MRRRLPAVVAVALALCSGIGPAAATPPVIDVVEGSESEPFETDLACGFTVRVAEDPDARFVFRTWDDGAGETRELITVARGTMVLTNLATGREVVVSVPGRQELTRSADGASQLLSSGRTMWGIRHPETGDFGFFLLTGNVRATFDAQGSLLSFEHAGLTVPLCPLLA